MKNKINPVWAETMSLYKKGFTISEISEMLGVDVAIVTNRITNVSKILEQEFKAGGGK